MDTFKTFIFHSYVFLPAKGEIQLNYSLDGHVKFTEKIILPHVGFVAYDPDELERALFMLHLIGGISYYKTCLPKQMEIRSGILSKRETKFWNTVYENGLGEFFYQNKIDFTDLINFPSATKPLLSVEEQLRIVEKNNARMSKLSGEQGTNDKPINEPTNQQILVPIGGGKDSMVTIELLKKAGFDPVLFRMGSHPFIDKLAEIAKLPMLTAERHLSPTLFDLNAKGALNGHVPITAYLSAVTVVLSILYGFESVVMSNERSANEGNVWYLGKDINHQWSKGLEFEHMFQHYLETTVKTQVQYFSLLRPLSELAIAKLFSTYPQYFEHVTSCNTNWKYLKENFEKSWPASQSADTDKAENTQTSTDSKKSPKRGGWCGKCPKCAFVFVLLAAYLPKDTLVTMFGKNLFDDETLIPLYRQLLDLEGFKPFECVGTPEETASAFILAHERGGWEQTPVMKMALEETGLPADVHALIEQELTPSDDHAIPQKYESAIL
ncbi:MAG: hypothetical protein JWM56_837 [Candidatus Peribacteria bacterium]|nr:hypothetical protein [Candidatus Peribacteria bacterium]